MMASEAARDEAKRMGGMQQHLREVLPQQHARAVWRNGDDMELLAKTGHAAVAHNVRRIEADDLGG